MIGHTWLPYFSEHTGQAEYVRGQSKIPIKFNRSKKPTKQNYSEERVEWRKHLQTLLTQEILKKNKQKDYR